MDDEGNQAAESNIRSFILKVWVEGATGETGKKTWYGFITAVPSGERRYVKELSDITDMIAAHLETMGVSLQGYRRLQRMRLLLRRPRIRK